MSELKMGEAISRALGGDVGEIQHEDWRAILDIGSDLMPAAQAAAVRLALDDPDVGVAGLIEAVASAPPVELDPSFVTIGSIEPESLDFEMVGDAFVGRSPVTGPEPEAIPELEFGSGDLSYDSDSEETDRQETDREPEPDPDGQEHQFEFDAGLEDRQPAGVEPMWVDVGFDDEPGSDDPDGDADVEL